MLSYYVIKFESFDTEAFVSAILKSDTNGVILVWNYNGEIRVVHKPGDIRLKSSYRYFTPGSWTANRWIKWSWLCVLMGWILLSTVRQRRVKTFFAGGGDILLWIAQVLKVFGRIQQTATTIEDWSLIQPSDGFYARLTKAKQRFNDFLLCRLDTRVIVTTKAIYDARLQYWGAQAARNSVLLDHCWAWFIEPKQAPTHLNGAKDICLLGTMRRNYAIPQLFELLPELNQQYGMRLCIVGPESELSREYRELASKMGVAKLIDWKGFVSDEQLPKELQHCFCGLNIHESTANDHSLVVAGRVVHYLQNYLVPVVSPYSGVMVQVLEKYQLGKVCTPNAKDMRKAIVDAFTQRTQYAANMEKFFAGNPYAIQAKELLGA